MDPDANLEEMRNLAMRVSHIKWDQDDAVRLAELVEALDDWLCKGGYLPKQWDRKEKSK